MMNASGDSMMVVLTCVTVITAMIVVGLLAWIFHKKNQGSSVKNNVKSKSELDIKSVSFSNESLPYNPWQERLQRGVWNTSNTKTSTTTTTTSNDNDKPFKSSYYYAHNNPQSKGGYKDGLRMEDYTMNQPRLLSRNGSHIISSEQQHTSTSSESVQATIDRPQKVISRPTRFILRYLWDDPGKHNGIAYIRIEQLPGVTGSTTIPWTEWMAQQPTTPQIDTHVMMEQKSLRVIIHSSTCFYELKMDPLYGAIHSVKTIVGPKRLTIQLHKANKGKAWPHPYQSKTKKSD